MSLELLNTLGTFITVAIVAATAIAALVQLGHMRAGNQINAMINISEYFNKSQFTDAQDLINRKLAAALEDPAFRDYLAALLQGQTPPEVLPEYGSLRRAMLLVGNAYEDLGVLVKSDIIDKSLFFDRYAGIIIGAWRRLKTYTAFSREVTGKMALWENFELLTVLSEDWERLHPSVYPAGVRRLPLDNPWPVAPASASS